MKRARILLSAIIIFSLLGGVMAFKSRILLIYYIESQGKCTLTTRGTIQTTSEGIGILTHMALVAIGSPCPITWVIIAL
jgi:hypothetical protein